MTFVRTTAWFTLAETFLTQFRVRSVALVPRLRLRPVHPEAAADLLAAVAAAPPPVPGAPAVRELAGPEVLDAAAMARSVAAARQPGVRVVGVPLLRRIGEAMVPGLQVPFDGRRFADWLRHGRADHAG